MSPSPRVDAFGIVVSDMARSLAFYRALGLSIPADADGAPHTEVELAGGLRLMFDTEDTVRSFKEIIDGKCDALPEQAFYMAGAIEEVHENAKKLAATGKPADAKPAPTAKPAHGS